MKPAWIPGNMATLFTDRPPVMDMVSEIGYQALKPEAKPVAPGLFDGRPGAVKDLKRQPIYIILRLK